MRKLILGFLFLVCAITTLGKVRVLTIGIGHYPSGSGWCDLGAVNDVALLKEVFPDAMALSDEKATHKGIEVALKELERSSSPGDTVIIHFSGHGQQVLALNDKNEPDKVDEALVAYDARRKKSSTYNGQAHFIDDEFGSHITSIRKKVGPNGLVLAVIDACHSNSMDRETDKNGDIYRGTDEVFGADNLSKEDLENLRSAYNNKETEALPTSGNMSGLVLMSACETDQRNYETKVGDRPYGSLSYYFAKAVRENGIADIDGLLTTVYNGMADDPTLEFHEQLPVIRTTVGWGAPKKETFVPADTTDTESGTSDENQSYTLYLILGGLAIIVLIILLCWKKRKK